MHIVDQPAAAVRPHHVDRQHLVAILALQLHAERAQLIVPGDEQRAFDDAVAGVVEILLNYGEALPQHGGVHRAGGGAPFRAPQLAHALLIVGLHRGEELRDRLIHRLRNHGSGSGAAAGTAGGDQEQTEGESSLHAARPVVKVTRR